MKTNNKKDDKNYGIAILRVILSFMVVIDHFYKNKKKYVYLLYYHIPTFFLISFYYTHKTLVKKNISKIKLRFERLIIPHFCWSIISLVLNNIYYYLFKRPCFHTLNHFVENILNGHILILPLWFQNILILTTLIITIIIFLFKNRYLLIFLLLMILAYIFQYTGINYRFFKNHYNVHYYLTYGRFLDTLPNSITGFVIASFSITKKLKNYKLYTIFLSIGILVIITQYTFDKDLKSFKYGGLRLNIAAICVFFIFFYLFDKIKSDKTKNCLEVLSNYTAGVYFVHYLIGRSLIMKLLFGKKLKTVFGCIIIYFISYISCLIMDKIIGKTKLKHLIK